MRNNPFEGWEEIPEGAINSYDIDGVIYMGEHMDGLRPGPNDIVITSLQSSDLKETDRMLLF